MSLPAAYPGLPFSRHSPDEQSAFTTTVRDAKQAFTDFYAAGRLLHPAELQFRDFEGLWQISHRDKPEQRLGLSPGTLACLLSGLSPQTAGAIPVWSRSGESEVALRLLQSDRLFHSKQPNKPILSANILAYQSYPWLLCAGRWLDPKQDQPRPPCWPVSPVLLVIEGYSFRLLISGAVGLLSTYNFDDLTCPVANQTVRVLDWMRGLFEFPCRDVPAVSGEGFARACLQLPMKGAAAVGEALRLCPVSDAEISRAAGTWLETGEPWQSPLTHYEKFTASLREQQRTARDWQTLASAATLLGCCRELYPYLLKAVG